MRKNEIIGISIALVLFATVVSVILLKDIIITAQAIEITILFVLVLVTIVYAKRTSDIADEAKRQRYSECLPLLVPSIPPILKTDELPYESLQSGIGIKVIWRNAGKGAAINSRFSFYLAPTSSGKAELLPPHELGALEVGGKKEVDFDKVFGRYWRDDKGWQQISDEYQPRLEAQYQDIYQRPVTTVQKVRIEEHDNEKRAFLGELYFTVNGRRLGGETAKDD